MRKNSLYIISSFFFACILFIYATSTNYQNSNSARQVRTETYTNTVLNVPIDIQYDSEMQESTRKFKVKADLTNASVGTIEVPLTIENLPSGLTAVATPQKITVKVGKKAKRDNVIVVPEIDPSQIDSRVKIDTVTVSDEKVTVISDEETLSRVDRVIAILPTSERITGNYSASVPLQAVDKNGNVLPSVIMPFDTTMKLTTKTVSSSSSSSSATSSTGSSTSSSSSTSSETKPDSSKQD